MKGYSVKASPALERVIIEFQLARNANIGPSELAKMSKKKVYQFYTIMQEVMKQEEKEIKKASKT